MYTLTDNLHTTIRVRLQVKNEGQKKSERINNIHFIKSAFPLYITRNIPTFTLNPLGSRRKKNRQINPFAALPLRDAPRP